MIPLVVVVGRIRISSVFSPTKSSPLTQNLMGHNREDLTRRRNRPNIHKGMTPLLTQNLKAVDLWVFFLIYCLTFSFLFNVGLRLALGFLTRGLCPFSLLFQRSIYINHFHTLNPNYY